MRRVLLIVLATAATILAVASTTLAQRASDTASTENAAGPAAPSTVGPAAAVPPQPSDPALPHPSKTDRPHPSNTPHPSDAAPPNPSSPTPHPRNTPPPTATPEPLAPPPVGPYRPQEHPRIPPDWQQQLGELDVIAELGHKNLAAGTKRLFRDVEAGAVTPARATRIALAKLGYLHPRGVPKRYRGEVTQHDTLALTYAIELAGPKLSESQRDRIAAEIDAYVHGDPAPATP
jgi:hypothetical protein